MPKQAAKTFLPEAEVFVPLEGLIDVDAERRRLEKERDRVSRLIESARARLANGEFLEKAPAEVVQRERDKLEEHEQKLCKLEESLSTLS